ncbi:nitric oxide reductase activation protein [Virgibacillus halotolerans]|uniref:vWA domain-containing protein n=1 Tax=Virgibacillus halotolerans TaxID=1071053 RepID=UPI0019617380|nr:VWA domain-containing protein [Virgibacillus halotolerans]MBM7601586.1 nitric oxide reductase activation protein [Virgibacillus halotolerans]
MRFNQWIDTSVDTSLFLLLQDLSTVLSGNPDLKFEYSFGSYIDITNNIVTGSSMWDVENQVIKESGYKSDLFLRTVGTLHYSDVQVLKTYLQDIDESSLPKFAAQLVTLLEDLRLEEIIKKDRPGTKRDFTNRKRYLKHFFTNQIAATSLKRDNQLGELFCLIYLLLQADTPDPRFPKAHKQQLNELEKLKPLLYEIFEAKRTADITKIAMQIVSQLESNYQDNMNDFFTFPISKINRFEENTLFDELTRTDELANEDKEDINDQDEFIDERFSTWHRENENSDRKQMFLQFELESGTKTSIMGGDTRETEDGNEAMGTVQGTSGESDQNDFSELPSLEKKAGRKSKDHSETSYGEENKNAKQIVKHAQTPSTADRQLYQKYVNGIDAYKRKLATTIEKTLEHKKNAPRKDLIIGRLSKKLLPLVLDENPRVFYKKSEESKDIDAVFTLLVDCSASMHNKMDETKRGIVLFHEVLTKLNIPHSIVGFWEDANDAKDDYQPNFFHIVHDFNDSLYQNTGANIMQLEPEEDNRDGFSIRVATKELAARREKNKFLLVFSDGEPAAYNYDQNGIVDTNVAVAEARKKGIEVIGMFLADGEIDEQEDITMKNIYGKERLMIPSVAELPEHFAPLLKKLLLRTI